MDPFLLDPRLEADSLAVHDLPLSAVRLMRDSNFPWLLLVPRRAGLTEIHQLDRADRVQLLDEIVLAGDALRNTVPCDKLNVAALGNVVPQLHVHVIARRRGDAAWPKPVWAAVPSRPYPPGEAEVLAKTLGLRLAADAGSLT